jgi:hypothetical protein
MRSPRQKTAFILTKEVIGSRKAKSKEKCAPYKLTEGITMSQAVTLKMALN